MEVIDPYKISIFGAFNVSSSTSSFRIRNDKDKALIAILVLSPDYKRTRRWITALLWGELSEDRAAANLRQAIWRIRRVFKGSAPLIEADRDNVWIKQENVSQRAFYSDQRGELLEGICIDEEAFEDWLRQHRVDRVETRRVPADAYTTSSEYVLPKSSLPQVAIFPSAGFSSLDRSASDVIVNVISKTLLEQRCVDVFDLRDRSASKFHPFEGSPAFGLFTHAMNVDGILNFFITMRNLVSNKVIWSRWIESCMISGEYFSKKSLYYQVSEIANAIHDEVYHACKGLKASGMFGAIQEVLSHSKEGQARAKPWLTDAANESGVARAWLMYTYAVAHAERYGGLDPSSMEELRYHCAKAGEAEPDNPIVRAIIGHINAFVFRDFEEAEGHHCIARQIGWQHPVVWTLSAMHANYTCRPDDAYQYSSRALSQSQFSPNRFYFAGPYSISCSLTNRHQEAISVGNAILTTKPGFLAVMRHLVASQAHAGNLAEARAGIHEIRLKDPQFARKDIAASDYPLPSWRSVALINSAFEITGL